MTGMSPGLPAPDDSAPVWPPPAWLPPAPAPAWLPPAPAPAPANYPMNGHAGRGTIFAPPEAVTTLQTTIPPGSRPYVPPSALPPSSQYAPNTHFARAIAEEEAAEIAKEEEGWIDAVDLEAMDIQTDWLVTKVLTVGEPFVIGGMHKTMKTSIAIDLAVSLVTATLFLGHFAVPRPV